MATVQETYDFLRTHEFPYIAIDVETANEDPESICEIAIAFKEGSMNYSLRWFVRPPTKKFTFTYLHGITYEMVQDADPFASIWDTQIAPALHTQVLAAHYAHFDVRAIWYSYVSTGGKNLDSITQFVFRDTCILARKYLPSLPDHKLGTVCEAIGAKVQHHHDASSDAMACVDILTVLTERGFDVAFYDLPFGAAIDKASYNRTFFGNTFYPKPSLAHFVDSGESRSSSKEIANEIKEKHPVFTFIFQLIVLGLIVLLCNKIWPH